MWRSVFFRILFFSVINFFVFSNLCVQVLDLLVRGSRSSGGLRVREEQQRGFYVEGLRTVPCESAAQVERMRAKVSLSDESPSDDP